MTKEDVFTTISLLIAALFGWGFLTQAGFPPVRIQGNEVSLVITLIFFILPFAKKLDFFQFFSFEAKIAEVKKEVGETKGKVADVREDVRHVIAQQNALSASVQSMNTQAVTVNNYDRPRQEQVEAAAAEVAGVEPLDPIPADPIISGLSADDKLINAIFGDRDRPESANSDRTQSIADLFIDINDINDINEIRRIQISERVAILRLRVDRELKRLLKPHAGSITRNGRLVKRMNLPYGEMVAAAMGFHPELTGQRDSFNVFFRIATAAAHADEVPYSDLETAIYLGERLLGLVSRIEEDPSDDPKLPLE
jgi:hypothetical protein